MMAKRTYRSADALLSSPFFTGLGKGLSQMGGTDRVLRSTGLEDMIYHDLRSGDTELDALEARCLPRLETFSSLTQDVFQSFYSLNVQKNPEENLTGRAKRFNANILNGLMAQDDYRAIKSVCEGEQLPAYEAAGEFAEQIENGLDGLLEDICGDTCKPELIDRLQEQSDDLCAELQDLAAQWQRSGEDNEVLEQKLLQVGNAAASKARQVAALEKRAAEAALKNQEKLGGILASALSAAADKAQETHEAIVMWGGDPSSPKKETLNQSILDRVSASPRLAEISRRLGRLLDIVAEGKKNGYAYGRGEKYSIERGKDLNHVLSSEFAYLALPETTVQFIHKYQRKALKQYRRREPVYKGCGDIIMCMDDSGSTAGSDNAWGKAAAMALMRIARDGRRRFALIHFADAGDLHTDIFLPGQYSTERMMDTAELFLNGGTDYETPMLEALRLMEDEGFQKADVLFVTDGACAMPESFVEKLYKKQKSRQFQVTGILLDQSGPGFAFSLEPFCQKVYRTSELTMEQIASNVVVSRI